MGAKMKWYEVKERSAGEKRLLLTYYIFMIFGRIPVLVIAFFVALVTFCRGNDLRVYVKKYLSVVGEKPNYINVFRLFLSYAISSVDKIEVFAQKFDKKKINTDSVCDLFWKLRGEKQGAVCVFSHVGNIDVARVLIGKEQKISILLSIEQAKTFRDFLGKISDFKNINLVAVEDIGIETVIDLKNRIENGEFVFVAGDRTAKTSKNIEVEVLGRKVDFPYGSFKLAELLESSVFFVSCLKMKKGYEMTVEQFMTGKKCAKKMADAFAVFVTEQVTKCPFQFYHFYDFFKDEKNIKKP